MSGNATKCPTLAAESDSPPTLTLRVTQQAGHAVVSSLRRPFASTDLR